jgi:hypothetical protein
MLRDPLKMPIPGLQGGIYAFLEAIGTYPTVESNLSRMKGAVIIVSL